MGSDCGWTLGELMSHTHTHTEVCAHVYTPARMRAHGNASVLGDAYSPGNMCVCCVCCVCSYEVRSGHRIRLQFDQANVSNVRLSGLAKTLLAPSGLPRNPLQDAVIKAIQEVCLSHTHTHTHTHTHSGQSGRTHEEHTNARARAHVPFHVCVCVRVCARSSVGSCPSVVQSAWLLVWRTSLARRDQVHKHALTTDSQRAPHKHTHTHTKTDRQKVRQADRAAQRASARIHLQSYHDELGVVCYGVPITCSRVCVCVYRWWCVCDHIP